jgi:hypothetical protein
MVMAVYYNIIFPQKQSDLKRFLILLLLSLSVVTMNAQKCRFSQEQFEADLERFIVVEAGLSPVESARFFPVYREMRKKQMALFYGDRELRHVDTSNEKACAAAIRKHDDNDLQVKKLQKEYHNRFLKILPAAKVYRVLRAEDNFHRRLFKQKSEKGQ